MPRVVAKFLWLSNFSSFSVRVGFLDSDSDCDCDPEPDSDSDSDTDSDARDLRDTQTQERRRLVRLFLWLKVFCYNARLHEERDDLRDKIDMMIPDDIREEVIQMGKTMAEHDREVAQLEKSRTTLLRQLQRRFGEIPEDLVAIIEGTKDQARLDGWLDRFATADRLEDVGIG
jgi:hypothetical protein